MKAATKDGLPSIKPLPKHRHLITQFFQAVPAKTVVVSLFDKRFLFRRKCDTETLALSDITRFAVELLLTAGAIF
jgi:hypothetical protein